MPGWQGATRALIGLALAVLTGLAGERAAAADRLPLVPAPLRSDALPGVREVRTGAPVVVPLGDAAARRTAEILIDLTAKAGGPRLMPATRGEGGVRFVREPAPAPAAGEEAYGLRVGPEGIVVTAATDVGLFRGAMSAVQLLTRPGAEGQAPYAAIADAPRFGWRGLMLDSARHYQSPAFIRSLIDAMALNKLNVLHWHLTDDQAWRLEIKRYPALTKVGAWRVPAGEGPAADLDPTTGRPRLYGGFYSQAEVRALVAYAAARHVTIVPEIDVPGHASAAIAAYPQLAAAPHPSRVVPADWGVYPNLFATDAPTLTFLENVLDEVMSLFPSTYIHLGGDEAIKDQWKASPRVQAQIRSLGLKDETELQGWFVRRLEHHLAAKGRRLIGWDEILEGGGAPPSATIMSWRGLDGGVAAARAGHDAVLSPAPLLYFDNRQSAGLAEPPGRGRVVGLQEVYAFDPAPPQLKPEEQSHILGVQGNLWTEHVRTEARAAHMAFPRALAVAELGWSPPAAKDWAEFSRRAEADVIRLNRMGFAAARSEWTKDPPPGPLRRESRELKTCSDKLTIALEDDAPVRGERAIFLTDIMNPCWIWPAATLDGVTALKIDVGQLPFNFQIGADVQKIPLQTPRSPSGDLELRLDSCTAAPFAVLSLNAAAKNPAVTTLTAPAPVGGGVHDLCLTFARARVDPIWAIGAVELVKDGLR